jgi:hypothetical protein
MKEINVRKIALAVCYIMFLSFVFTSCSKEDDADKFVGEYTSSVEPINLSITKIDAQAIKLNFDNGESILIGQVENSSLIINKQDADSNDFVKGSGSISGKVLNLQIIELNSLGQEEDVFDLIYVK